MAVTRGSGVPFIEAPQNEKLNFTSVLFSSLKSSSGNNKSYKFESEF